MRLLPSDAAGGFRLDPARLEAAITPASRLLVLNSPSNPTGTVLQRAELEAIAAVLRRHPQVAVVCDEIYEFLLAPGQEHHSFAAVAPDLADRVFVVNGFAKGWAMTGWRVGWLAGPRAVVDAAIALQSQSTSNVCSFAQYGALAAIEVRAPACRRWRSSSAPAASGSAMACGRSRASRCCRRRARSTPFRT